VGAADGLSPRFQTATTTMPDHRTTWQPSAISCLLVCCGLLFCTTAAVTADDSRPPARRVFPVDGPSWSGVLRSVTSAGKLLFAQRGKRQELAWDDLVQWGSPSEPRRGSLVVTTGGSWLVGAVLEMRDDRLTIRCQSAGRLVVPMTHVRGLLFVLPIGLAARDRLFTRIESDVRNSDRVLLVNGDLLHGTLVGLDGHLLRLETASSGTLRIRRDRVVAFFANPALLTEPSDRNAARTQVGLQDGSLWRIDPGAADATSARGGTANRGATEPGIAETTGLRVTGGRVRARLTDGLQVSDLALDELVFLCPASRRLVYLSDLVAAATMCRPYLQLPWRIGEDRAAHGGLLRAGGQLYVKGLGMHSTASVTYRLDGSFARFDTDVAIDNRAGQRGSVRFRVALLQSGRWDEEANVVVRGGQPPRTLSIDLTRATAIRLTVDMADHGDEGDFADWLLARLVRSPAPVP